MSATGYIQVHTYTSSAQLPLQDAAVTISNADGAAIAMRLTNSSGKLNVPVPITVPDRSASLAPNSGSIPFTIVNLYARKEGYEEIFIQNLQVFADTITLQPLQLIPIAELPGLWNKAESFETTTQNL